MLAARLPSKAKHEQPDPAVGPAPQPSLPYGEALLQREYELWQRQTEMLDRLQRQHEEDRRHWEQDRSRRVAARRGRTSCVLPCMDVLLWAAHEARLQQELAELRSQLLFVLTKLGDVPRVMSGSSSGGSAASYTPSVRQQQLASSAFSGASAMAQALGTAPSVPPALPLGAGASPAAEQIRAAVEALRSTASSASESGPAEYPFPLSAAGGGGSTSALEAEEPPAFAADLLAALAAVEEADVLNDEALKAQAARWKQYASGADAAGADAPPAASSKQQQPQQQQRAPAPAPAAAPATAPAAAPAAAAPPPAEPAGLPPTLVVGSDDIYWVNQLHTGLVEAGYYPGDDDVEDFFFGESTQSALLTMQARIGGCVGRAPRGQALACEGLAETGVADEATWVKLLGPELTPFPSGGSEAGAAGEASSPAVAPGASADAKPFEQLFSLAFTETVEGSPGGEVRDAQRLEVTAATLAPVAGDASWEVVEEERLQAEAEAVAGAGGEVAVHGSASVQARHLEQGQQQLFTEWPVLFEGDGGRAVHGMQVALIQEGYYPDEDEMRWWNFGSSTLAALKTFQASLAIDFGVCDTGTWQALLGPGASPADIVSLRSEDSELEEDLTEQSDRVWLIGEQRWENRRRLRK
eukprot:scaffold20.g7821.t1